MSKVLVFIGLLFLTQITWGANKVCWSTPNDPSIEGYVVHYGPSRDMLHMAALSRDSNCLQLQIPNSWYYAVTSYTANGERSKLSNIVRVGSTLIPLPPTLRIE